MDSRTYGEGLSQLARVLFNAAADKWYGALLLEVLAGGVAAAVAVLGLGGDPALFGSLIGVMLLVFAHGFRLWADHQYDLAETMRRQAAFSEGLGWAVDPVQVSRWRQRAGRRARNSLKQKTRAEDYYATESQTGPQRLAEMTRESAFYTRHLYDHLRLWIWILVVGALIVAFVIVSLALSRTVPDSLDSQIAQVLYIVIPVLISANLIGWGLRLNRSVGSIVQIESDVQRLLTAGAPTETDVVRLVSEYNCELVSGIPIHNRLFSLWHDEIREHWNQTLAEFGNRPHHS